MRQGLADRFKPRSPDLIQVAGNFPGVGLVGIHQVHLRGGRRDVVFLGDPLQVFEDVRVRLSYFFLGLVIPPVLYEIGGRVCAPGHGHA